MAGRVSKKLEDIAAINGFINHNAHDALGDVDATIFVANLIRTKTPLLWHRALETTSRQSFKQLLAKNEIFIVYDNNFGWPTIYPACLVGGVQGGRNSLFFDLRHEPDAVLGLSAEKKFAGRNRPFRVCRETENPLIFNLQDVNKISAPELPSIQEIETRFHDFQRLDVSNEVLALFEEQKKDFPESEYVEQKIYDDFSSFDDERDLMNQFHMEAPENKN